MKIVVAGLFYALLTTLALAQCDTGEVKIRLGVFNQPQDKPRIRAIDRLSRAIDNELQGKACLDVMNDEGKYAGTSAIVALQNGEVDIIAPKYSALGQFIPAYRIYTLPFAFRDDVSVQRFNGLAKNIFQSQFDQRGLLPITVWDGGANQLAAKNEVYVPNDVAGLRFQLLRSPGFGRFVSALKATQQNVTDENLAEAIKNQRVTVVSKSWEGAQSLKLLPVLDGITESNHSYDGYTVVTSRAWWEKLDKPLQKTLNELINRIGRQSNFDTAARMSNVKQSFMRSGTPVRTLTRKQRENWQRVMTDIWEGFESFQTGKEILNLREAANSGL